MSDGCPGSPQPPSARRSPWSHSTAGATISMPSPTRAAADARCAVAEVIATSKNGKVLPGDESARSSGPRRIAGRDGRHEPAHPGEGPRPAGEGPEHERVGPGVHAQDVARNVVLERWGALLEQPQRALRHGCVGAVRQPLQPLDVLDEHDRRPEAARVVGRVPLGQLRLEGPPRDPLLQRQPARRPGSSTGSVAPRPGRRPGWPPAPPARDGDPRPGQCAAAQRRTAGRNGLSTEPDRSSSSRRSSRSSQVERDVPVVADACPIGS